MLEFFRSHGYIHFDSEAQTSFRSLYNTYRGWCEDNALQALSSNSFSIFLQQNQQTYQLTYSRNISIGNGKSARGYRGIKVLPR